PSGAMASAVNPADHVGTGNSANRPLAKRPILFACISRNHTAPSGAMATSPSCAARVGGSSSDISPRAEIRTSRFTRGSVPHTVPLASTATPNGATPGAVIVWRVNAPSLKRVKLYVGSSANPTAPSGAAASRPSLATGVESANDVTTPSGDIREIRRLGPSVYHA